MPIYPLPPGCVFREDFTSYDTVVANGGEIHGNGFIINKKVFVNISNTSKITYSNTKTLLNNASTCTIAISLKTGADVTSVTDILGSAQDTNLSSRLTIAIYSGIYSNLFFIDKAGTSQRLSNTISTNTRYTFVTTFDGSLSGNNKANLYTNGILTNSYGTNTFLPTLLSGTSRFSILSQEVSGLRSVAGTKLYTVQLYDYAFTAADALLWHNNTLRTY